MSKRQDWCAEVSWNFYNLITPIITFTVSLCAMAENVLRDAVLVRLENIRFEAYVHVNGLMWKVAFAELRALTNRKTVRESGFGLNPLELNDLYEYLWNLGVKLQSNSAMEVFDAEFRPWPKLREADAISRTFYERLDRNKQAHLLELNAFRTRVDVVRYSQELKTQLALFGTGIVTSLQRTMGHYLKVCTKHLYYLFSLHPSLTLTLAICTQATCGKFRNELKEEWEVEEVAKLLCTNNAAERPFAIAKAYLNIYGRMKLSNLAQFSLAMCNGSHRLAGPNGKQERTTNRLVEAAGMALTCDPRLKTLVTELCTMRRAKYGRKHIGLKPGSISELLAKNFESDKLKANERRLAKEAEEKAKMAKKHLNKAVKFNLAVEEPLGKSTLELHQNLKAMEYRKGVCVA